MSLQSQCWSIGFQEKGQSTTAYYSKEMHEQMLHPEHLSFMLLSCFLGVTMDKIAQLINELKANPASYDVNQLIAYFAVLDLSIAQAILVVRQVQKLDMQEAKGYVSEHPAYAKEHKNSAHLHQELKTILS